MLKLDYLLTLIDKGMLNDRNNSEIVEEWIIKKTSFLKKNVVEHDYDLGAKTGRKNHFFFLWEIEPLRNQDQKKK